MKHPRNTILLALLLISFGSSAQPALPKRGFDIHVLYELKKTRTPGKNAFFRTMSDLNNPICLAVPAVLFIVGWIQKKKSKKMAALEVTETLAISQSLTFLIKWLVGRLRPALYDTAFVPVVIAINKSFPSGHTSEAFAMAASLLMLRLKWYFVVPAFIWGILIGYARMYLGVHYPTDVAGGIVLGMGTAYFTYWMNKKAETRRTRKASVPTPDS